LTPAARRALATLGVTVAAVAMPFAIPAVRDSAWTVVGLLVQGDIPGLRAYLLGFGAWAPVVSALLMVGQAIVAPLPAFVITLTNGLLFGALWGGLLSWSSALAGAWLCFWLARTLGRPFAERLVGRTALEAADRFFVRYGIQAIVLARLLPFVPFDPISYAAGLTRMGAVRFLVATGLGQLPATILYSYAGQQASHAAEVLLWVFGATVVVSVVGQVVRKRRAARRAAGSDTRPAADVSTTLQ
jgi:uncharacterized membrane protein YdjX (TVP38/TMEM64 family)